MNTADLVASCTPMIRPDGCLQSGTAVCEPWPSLAVRGGTLGEFSRDLLDSRPGDASWPFAAVIPEDIKGAVRSIPSGSGRLLELAAANPARALPLLRDCPALAVHLVHAVNCTGADRRERFRELLQMPWRKLAGEMNLPARPRTVHLLRRVPAAHCTPATVQSFCEHIEDGHPLLRIVAHQPRITRDTVALLGLEPALVNSKLLLASGSSSAEEEPMYWMVTGVRWLLDLDEPNRPWPFRQLDAAGLARVETRLRRCHEQVDDANGPYPPPPFAGERDTIVPLRDFGALLVESDRQVNCAQAYAHGVAFGVFFVYAVMSPERATLVLQWHAEKVRWEVLDLKARNNDPVREETQRYVQSWLDREQEPITDQTEEAS